MDTKHWQYFELQHTIWTATYRIRTEHDGSNHLIHNSGDEWASFVTAENFSGNGQSRSMFIKKILKLYFSFINYPEKKDKKTRTTMVSRCCCPYFESALVSDLDVSFSHPSSSSWRSYCPLRSSEAIHFLLFSFIVRIVGNFVKKSGWCFINRALQST